MTPFRAGARSVAAEPRSRAGSGYKILRFGKSISPVPRLRPRECLPFFVAASSLLFM